MLATIDVLGADPAASVIVGTDPRSSMVDATTRPSRKARAPERMRSRHHRAPVAFAAAPLARDSAGGWRPTACDPPRLRRCARQTPTRASPRTALGRGSVRRRARRPRPRRARLAIAHGIASAHAGSNFLPLRRAGRVSRDGMVMVGDERGSKRIRRAARARTRHRWMRQLGQH